MFDSIHISASLNMYRTARVETLLRGKNMVEVAPRCPGCAESGNLVLVVLLPPRFREKKSGNLGVGEGNAVFLWEGCDWEIAQLDAAVV
jgi:hypothetical protein